MEGKTYPEPDLVSIPNLIVFPAGLVDLVVACRCFHFMRECRFIIEHVPI